MGAGDSGYWSVSSREEVRDGRIDITRIPWTPAAGRGGGPPSARRVFGDGLPGPLGRADAAHTARPMVVHHGGPGEIAGDLGLAGVSETAHPDVHHRHQLRDEVGGQFQKLLP